MAITTNAICDSFKKELLSTLLFRIIIYKLWELIAILLDLLALFLDIR